MSIGKRFKKHVFNCPDGTKWNIGKKILVTEKEIESDGRLYKHDAKMTCGHSECC